MKTQNSCILVIDDELQIRKLLQITLESHGFEVLQAASSGEGLSIAANRSPDLVLLDLGLPDESGHETLRKLREWSKVPIIILTVQSNEEDIVLTLDGGANDYLVKPFRTGELLARIRSVLRGSIREENNPVIKFNNLELDLAGRLVRINDDTVPMTQIQYALLVLFAKNEGKVLTHQYILKEIWGEEYQTQLQYLRVFVAQLRRMLEDQQARSVQIYTMSGVGYRFECKLPESEIMV